MKRRTGARVSGGLLIASLIIRAIRDHGWAAYLAVVLAASVAGYIYGQRISHNTDRIARQERLLHEALRGSCDRVNTLRRNANRDAVDDYNDDLLSYFTNRVAARYVPNRVVMVRFAELARTARLRSRRRVWTPLTDCDHAVDTPLQFVAPRPLAVWRTPLGRIPQ